MSGSMINIDTIEGATEVLERDGDLTFCVVMNDGCDQNNYLLVGLKMVVSSQLPRMPKEYIVRLIFDKRHQNLIVLRKNRVIGGITYRMFKERNFVEIVFCTVSTDEQINGFGTRLMNHLKDYLKTRVQYMLTYADENAKGFFKKQGFSETILLERKQWKYYIKEYDSATLRCCQLFPQVNYQDVTQIMGRQRETVYRDICARSHFQHIYHLPDTPITNLLDIPGVREAGWTEATLADKEKSPSGLQERLGKVLEDIWNNPDSWPFKEPVAVQDVPDYLDIIEHPMDLRTMKTRLQQKYYKDEKMFLDDLQLIVSNAKKYNQKPTSYYKCADNIEKLIISHYRKILNQ